MAEINGFKIAKHNIYGIPENVKYHTCPICSESRKKKTQKCFSVYWDTGMGKCSHCGEVVQLHEFEKKNKNEKYKIPEWENKTELSDSVLKWFEGRKISQFTVRLMKISEGIFDMPDKVGWKSKNTIQFPYYRSGNLINVKYRGGDKSFRFTGGCEIMTYNIDNVYGHDIIYCVEGEMDVLAVMESGIHNVVSPPNGFTKKGNINLDWLNNDVDCFINADKIILAFDNDIPGENGKKEFIRRFGAHKCYSVDLKECKDSNEYLIKYGKESLKKALENYIEIPLEGVSSYGKYKENVRNFFINGMPKGMQTGTLKKFDENFSVNLSHVLLVTGIPSSGKSEVVDQMVIGYTIKHKCKIGFASPENKPNELHHQKLIRKLCGFAPKSISDFNDGFEAVENFVDDNFFMIDFENGYDLEKTLLKAEELVFRKGIKILVIDPFNKVKYKGKVESITGNRVNDYTNAYLTLLNDFGVKYNVFVILVAHPVKLPKEINGKRAIPDFYDVKGGGEFYDMCHHGLVVDRNYQLGLTLIRTLKVKFGHLGQNNVDTWYKYNMNNGRYSDIIGNPNEIEDITVLWDNDNWVTKGINNVIEPEIDYNKQENNDLDRNNWYETEKDDKDVPF